MRETRKQEDGGARIAPGSPGNLLEGRPTIIRSKVIDAVNCQCDAAIPEILVNQLGPGREPDRFKRFRDPVLDRSLPRSGQQQWQQTVSVSCFDKGSGG